MNDWADRVDSSFSTGSAAASGTVTGQGLEATLGLSGFDEADGVGKFSFAVIGRQADPSGDVTVEIKNERLTGDPIEFSFPAEVASQFPDVSGCEPETVTVSYDAYDAPNGFNDPPSYTIHYEGNCLSTESVDAIFDWARAHGSDIADGQQKLHVELPGPGGSTIQLAAYRESGAVDYRVTTALPTS